MLTVMILLVSFLTNSVDNFLTLLNVNGVNNLLASCLGDLARRLLTPFTLRSVRKLSTLFVRKLTSSIITVSMLLGMNQMLLLDLLAFMKNTRERAMVMDMEDMGVIRFFL